MLRAVYFRRFSAGVRALPQLSRLTYAREWPKEAAWNIMEHESRGPYQEALNDDEASLEDDWSGLRCVLETFKDIRGLGKTISLELRTPMVAGMLGPNIPQLNTLSIKVKLDAYVITCAILLRLKPA